MSDQFATLLFDNQEVKLPMRTPTLGNDVIDVTSLGKYGVFTYDPGFLGTASCESHITYIDGGKGILLYRGYPIEQLAEQASFEGISYLLLHGELPQQKQKTAFIADLNKHMTVTEQAKQVLSGFSQDAHPMAMMMGVLSALAASHDDFDVHNKEHRHSVALQIIAKMPAIAAMCYRRTIGEKPIDPDPSLSYAANFYNMAFGKAPSEVVAEALDKIFILHADHEQNASTSTVRLSGSTGTNPYAAIASGVAALWGPAHGGANEACLTMLEEIGDEAHIPEYIEKAKDSNDPFRLMGFGHRVYKSFDPRAKIMRKTCHDVLEEINADNIPLFKLARKLEKIALEDEYFIKRNLYPNVDFYSGITQSALQIPTPMFTVIFALARTAGWISHWVEMYDSPEFRIGRPRQLYVGPDQRDFIPIDKRG